MLVVGGCCGLDPDEDDTHAKKLGLTAWRTLSAEPHYKLVTDLEEDLRQVARSNQLIFSAYFILFLSHPVTTHAFPVFASREVGCEHAHLVRRSARASRRHHLDGDES